MRSKCVDLRFSDLDKREGDSDQAALTGELDRRSSPAFYEQAMPLESENERPTSLGHQERVLLIAPYQSESLVYLKLPSLSLQVSATMPDSLPMCDPTIQRWSTRIRMHALHSPLTMLSARRAFHTDVLHDIGPKWCGDFCGYTR
jgi:hypothetical protein